MNWNLHCWGMAYTFRNINYESADKFMLYYCSQCHMPALGGAMNLCQACGQSESVVRIPNTYITNLAFQELYAAGFGHTFMTEPLTEDQAAEWVDEQALEAEFQRLSSRVVKPEQ